MIKGFIFDLDGVITETAKLHYISWKKEVKKIGIDFTEEQNSSLKGLPRRDTLLAILKIHNRELSDDQINKIAEQKNVEYKKLLEKDVNEENILSGITNFLKEAKEKNIKMAIASSSLNAPLILEKINLLDYFSYIVNPAKISKGKPAPDIYLDAVKGINLNIDEVVGFEDAMPGVIGLKAANIKTVAITWGDKGDWQKADIVLKTTNDLNIEKILSL